MFSSLLSKIGCPALCYLLEFSGVKACELCTTTGVCVGVGGGSEFRSPVALGSEHPARRKYCKIPLKRILRLLKATFQLTVYYPLILFIIIANI